MRAFAPNGSPILGTLEHLSGRSEIVSDSFQKNDGLEGGVEFEHAGGTEIFYDDQRTVVQAGQRMFLAEDGTEWPESALVLLDVSADWSGSPDPADPDNFWIDDETGERINARTGERSPSSAKTEGS